MTRKAGWTIGCIISLWLWVLILWAVAAISGCDGGLTEGILIGAGTSTAATEGQKLAESKKTALIAEVLRLRQELDATTDPATVESLKTQLATAEKKQEIADLTDQITSQIKEGLGRDWSEPTRPDNLAWILGAGATVLGGLAGKKTLDDRKKAEVLTQLKINAKELDDGKAEAAIYRTIGSA